MIVALGWAVWRTIDTPEADAAQVSTLSPADQRQHDLLKEDLGRPGDPDLEQLYRTLNARYFAGRLPAIPVQWEPRLAEVGALAAQRFTLEGMFGHIGSREAILLNASLESDPAGLRRALCHEMVHAYLYASGDRTTNHGPAFQAELRRLSAEGAFEGIVATDAERRDLKAWLDTEAARLDADSEELKRESEDIERDRANLDRAVADLNARVAEAAARGQRFGDAAAVAAVAAQRDAYNRRVEDANARIEDGRRALAAFNRQVDRYNLMLVYPDGIDEDQLQTPRAVAER